MDYNSWYRSNGDPINANRLVLPDSPDFDRVAALVLTELVAQETKSSLAAAFASSESLIALLFSRALASDAFVLGLMGELLLLDRMLTAVSSVDAKRVLDGWNGFGRSARDFVWETVGLEVKTTTRATSSHHFQGIGQTEVGAGSPAEAMLFVLSVGLTEVHQADALSLTVRSLSESIKSRLEACGLSEQAISDFLLHVKEYGGDSGQGFDLLLSPEEPLFNRPFVISFVRLYDMSDVNMAVLRADDLRARPFVDGSSLSFRIDFPAQVSGDLNPTVGLRDSVHALAGRAAFDGS